MNLDEHGVFRRMGEEGLGNLVAAFYRRVLTDDILGPMYPKDDMPGAERRLKNFLIFRFGGPPHYTAERGHPRLGMRHAPFPITPAARDRWILLMSQAMQETNVDPESAAILTPFFTMVAEHMRNKD